MRVCGERPLMSHGQESTEQPKSLTERPTGPTPCALLTVDLSRVNPERLGSS